MATGQAVELVRLQQHPVCVVYLLCIEQEDHLVSLTSCLSVPLWTTALPRTAQPVRVQPITTTQHCRQSSLRGARVELGFCLSVCLVYIGVKVSDPLELEV